MIPDYVIQLLTCAVSDDKHKAERPIALSCSHHVCKYCIDKIKTETIKCKICHQINKSDLNDIKESICASLLLEQNISVLFNDVKAKIESTVNDFQSWIYFIQISQFFAVIMSIAYYHRNGHRGRPSS
jgi:hypothetical protein